MTEDLSLPTTCENIPAESKPDPITQARLLVEADKQARSKACLDAISAALKEHRCSLHTSQQLFDGAPRGPVNFVVTAEE